MAMMTKEIAMKTIEQLPEDASWEDIQGRINFVAGGHKAQNSRREAAESEL